MNVRILGKVWRLVFVPAARVAHLVGGRGATGTRGFTEPPTKRRKRIVISDELRGEESLEVTVHELLHAADWSKDEEWVEEAARDIARVLWRLGLRWQDETR